MTPRNDEQYFTMMGFITLYCLAISNLLIKYPNKIRWDQSLIVKLWGESGHRLYRKDSVLKKISKLQDNKLPKLQF